MAVDEKKLFKSLRGRGLRKRTAVDLVRATAGEAEPTVGRRLVVDLNSVVDKLNDRLKHGPEKRSAAAKGPPRQGSARLAPAENRRNERREVERTDV